MNQQLSQLHGNICVYCYQDTKRKEIEKEMVLCLHESCNHLCHANCLNMTKNAYIDAYGPSAADQAMKFCPVCHDEVKIRKYANAGPTNGGKSKKNKSRKHKSRKQRN